MLLKGKRGALAKPHVFAWEKEYRTGRGKWRGTTNFPVDLPPGSRILEVGCGNGKNLSSFFKGGLRVYAVDPSPTAVKLAKERAEFFKAKAHISEGDVCDLAFKANYFDAVFLFHVLGHLTAQERVLAVQECFRVLKPGGQCLFRGFHESDLRFGKGLQVEENTFRKGNNVWVHYFSEEEVRRLMEGTGFSVEKLALDAWKVWFRDKPYKRCEVVAKFRKP